jgi:hypothetical protein
MYGTSPAKREAIETQIKAWFEQDVIEKSISPWSAPVVIAYPNSKPRFCVDYRKLNAVTIADEFPIPRQTEILSSLAGSQVVSSLDALSGFTQLEINPDHVKKTAFRIPIQKDAIRTAQRSLHFSTRQARHLCSSFVVILPRLY